ncbi:hypothetical protein LINPERHAP2_LOCUS2489, partial [Linum perenne]
MGTDCPGPPLCNHRVQIGDLWFLLPACIKHTYLQHQ